MLYTNLLAQTILEINRNTEINGGGTGPGAAYMYQLPGNVISATVGLLYIIRQPEYELPRLTRFGQFGKFGKNGVGGTVLPSHSKKHFSARGPSSCLWAPVRQI